MAERAINQKNKGQFLQNIAPPSASFDQLVKDKLLCGKFPLTKTGWIKSVAMIISLAAIVLFVVQSQCGKAAVWFPYLLPACSGASLLIQLLFYLIFSCGASVNQPGKWVAADIILNFIFSIIAIIGSAMTVSESSECTQNVSMHGIPGPIGIVGGILSLTGCGAIFLMYRYVDEDKIDANPNNTFARNADLRKSMHV